MSVVGIDFGNESCYIAVAKAGGIETIVNDYSLRATPSCVAFQERTRTAGMAAGNARLTNMKNTIVNFKRLLGRKFNDPYVQQELKLAPYSIVAQPDGSIGIKVRYMDEQQIFSPEQITAMLFTHLKALAETALEIQVHDCVISVPWFYTQAERRAILDAAHIAGLNVLRLLNETTCAALAYGIYKQDLPPPEEKPRNVVLVDCGHASLQACAVAFNTGKLKILAAAADGNLGGRDFDRILADIKAKEFLTKYKIDVLSNPRAYLRLTTEIEKLKKQMSANSTKLPLNIECLMDEKDVSSTMQRQDMEEACQDLLKRVENTLLKCLHDSKLTTEEIYAVEIIGGSSRIPAIKNMIEDVFKKAPSTTLNQDEAVSRGAALQCALMSPSIKVKDFSVTDIQNYPVKIKWAAPGEEAQGLEIFPALFNVPFSRVTHLQMKKPFEVELSYNTETPYPDPLIGKFAIQDVKPTTEKVKLKVRVNHHGLVTLANAATGEVATAEEQDKIEKEEKMDVEQPVENGSGGDQSAANHKEEDSMDTQEDKKEKRKLRFTDVPIVPSEQSGLSESAKLACLEAEGRMAANDKQERDRVDVKNSLEEYVYELRNKLQDQSQLQRYVEPSVMGDLDRKLEDIVNWLYEDGEDCQKQVYSDKLDELKKFGEPIKSRKIEADVRPAVIEDLSRSIQQSFKIIDQYRNRDEKYAHIPEEDIKKAEKETATVEKWLAEKRVILQRTQLFENPPVTVAEIRQHKQSFENAVAPIYNKPKPKVDPPPTEDAPVADAAPPADGAPTSPKPEEKMETEG